MVKESTQHIPGDTAMSYLKLDRAGKGRGVWKLRVKLWPAALQVAGNILSTADKWDVRNQNSQELGIVGGTEEPNTRTEMCILIYSSITVTNTNCEGGDASQEQHVLCIHLSIRAWN